MRNSKVGQNQFLLAGFFVMAVICLARMGQVETNELFEEARVTAGFFRPTSAHNGCRLYLYLLHGAMFLLGNKVMAGAFLQALLQLGAAFFFCFTARRISGDPAAVVVLAVSCFSPYFLRQAVQLSPLWFFLFCYGGTAWLLTGLSGAQGQKKDIGLLVQCLFAGSLIGFCCYLDPAGVTLFAFMGGMIWMPAPWKERAAVGLGCVLAALILFFGLYGIQAGNFDAVASLLLSDWRVFRPGDFPDYFVDGVTGLTWDFVPAAVLAVGGLLLFLPRKRVRGRLSWLLAAGMLLALQLLGLAYAEPVDSYVLLYLICAALAGCSITDYLYFKESKMDNENKDVKQEGEAGGSGKPRYLENPLPLPKKHVKKVLDFDYDVSEDDDFDHP